MSNIALKVFWSNEPMPLNRKIDKAAITVPFGVMITHPTGLIKSVNGKVGDVVLNAADVGADGGVCYVSSTTNEAVFNLQVFNPDFKDTLRGFTWMAIGY